MKRGRESSSWKPPAGRWTAGDGLSMQEALSASGLSQRAFAAQHGIAAHRVSYWVGKQRSAPVTFREARVVADARTRDERAKVELELANGRRLSLVGGWAEADLQRWVRALEAV